MANEGLNQQLKFPPEIPSFMAELTLPREEAMEATFERKKEYNGLAAVCTEAG